MIQGTKDITSENPIKQIWKFLRFFLDTPSVSDTIRGIHSIPKGKFDSGIKKQARQIGYCIRQAEEYFHASAQVGLPTRPTLLYYGAVSLSQALVLLRQDGSHSIDALRKTRKHTHHGLNLVRGLAVAASPSHGPEAFFSSLECEYNTKEGIPWGHFALFYRSLVPCACQIRREIYDHGKPTFLQDDIPMNCADLLPLESLVSKRANILQLIKTLPDTYFALREIGMQPDLRRGNVKIQIMRHYKRNDQGSEQLERTNHRHDFFIDDLTQDQKAHLLASYKDRNPDIKLEAELASNIHLSLTKEFLPSEAPHLGYYPDIVDDMNGRKFYILRSDAYIPEPAAHYIVLYCLGMLSRYYPDVWMKGIDENVAIAELTDSLLNIMYRKFPNLILDQMTWVKHFVHL